MKNIKKIMALIVAMAMVIGTMTMAFAAPGDLDHNSKLTVSGLGENDTVEYYQILAWDQDANETDGWVFGNGIDTTKANGVITASDIYGQTDGENKITFDLAGTIGSVLKDPESSPAGNNNAGTWTVEGVDPGLYMVVVTSNTPGVIYNPIFVAANFKGAAETNVPGSSWIVTSDASYSDEAQAKKTTIPLDKKATGRDDNDGCVEGTTNSGYTAEVGEVIDYEVTTTIPKFGANYTKPVFKLTDELTGLELDTALPVVKAGTTTLTPGTDYTIDPDTFASGITEYTITFTQTYLSGLTAPTDITVTYAAKVTDAAEKSVNEENNTVTLNFSANPTDETGKAQLKDETNHFTFSIDAALFGSQYDNESSTEAIKIGVDKDGNPILSEQSYKFNGGVTHAALEGAEFALKDSTGTIVATATSDATGRITIKGLDVGSYTLVETKAPKGYIKLQNSVPVEINAKIKEEVTVTDEYDVDGTKITTTHKTNVLESYSVTVGGSTTTYTMENSADASSISISKIEASDEELANTKGVELPSTGGIGTTIFYVIGTILVIGAGVLLVTKRRMSAK
jgi:fimbrial isopeptide formation D2 family protein/LPXTG-motif cell wall-anchored protein